MMRLRKGFTLVEISLAMALLGVLSIIIVLLIGNAVSAYHRGLTLNQLNTVGMALTDELRGVVQNSPRLNYEYECGKVYENSGEVEKCKNDRARSFVVVERRANVTIGRNTTAKAPVYGAFCTGKYSYIWNSGYYFNSSEYGVDGMVGRARLKYLEVGGSASRTTTNDFKLLKVRDDNRAVCKSAAGATRGEYWAADKVHDDLNNVFDIACDGVSNKPSGVCNGIDTTTIDTDLVGMNSGQGGLALYDLSVVGPASYVAANSSFYSVSFVLGTVQGGINVMAQGNYCATPKGFDADIENFDYCAINKFNFAAQAVGGSR